MSEYSSDIPAAAQERIVEQGADGSSSKIEYLLDGAVVGVRFFDEDGNLSLEFPLLDGVLHGTMYRWDQPGVLLSAEPFEHGLPHGVAKQWEAGVLVGTYTMNRGDGIDLWWSGCGGSFALAEVRYLKGGQRHGYEWWLDGPEGRLSEERHCWHGALHGIEREWNAAGRLRRGFPRYYVNGERVDKRRYLRACASHAELPPFRQSDQKPVRSFPPEVAQHVRLVRP